MPTLAPVRREVITEINRLTGPGANMGTIVEAGSGWGTLAFSISKNCLDWRQVIGIENSFVPLWISRQAARLRVRIPVRGEYIRTPVTFIKGDLYDYAFEDVDLVVCYLYPGAMKRLSVIFNELLALNTRIISVCFALPGWQPERVITCRDLYRTKVYVYVKG